VTTIRKRILTPEFDISLSYLLYSSRNDRRLVWRRPSRHLITTKLSNKKAAIAAEMQAAGIPGCTMGGTGETVLFAAGVGKIPLTRLKTVQED
jgi:hypothetical protein